MSLTDFHVLLIRPAMHAKQRTVHCGLCRAPQRYWEDDLQNYLPFVYTITVHFCHWAH